MLQRGNFSVSLVIHLLCSDSGTTRKRKRDDLDVLCPLSFQERCGILLQPVVNPDIWVNEGIDDGIGLDHDKLSLSDDAHIHVKIENVVVTIVTNWLLADQ